jgi:hypothetical protein
MRYVFLLMVAFAAGFLIRDYVGPVKLPVSLWTIRNAVNSKPAADFVPGNVDIVYDNGAFSPAEAIIPVGRYLSVTNRSESLMWLESNNPWLSTSRGFGLSEQVRVRMDEEGTYTIKNKLNLDAKAVVKVVP